MEVKSPELKMVISNIIRNESKVDEKGVYQKRKEYPRSYYKATKDLMKLMLSDIEIAMADISKAKKGKDGVDYWESTDFEWVPLDKVVPDQNKKGIAERFTDKPLSLTTDMINAFKFYLKEYDHLPEMSDECVELLEGVIGEKI